MSNRGSDESPPWEHVEYTEGDDPLWDDLGGDKWGAIDLVVPGIRVYATWDEQHDGRMVVTGLCLRGSADRPLTAEALRLVPIGRLEAAANEVRRGTAEWWLEKVPPLTRPSARPSGTDPDYFYKLVGDHYRWHSAISHKPAAKMAEASDVPVTTVHRWIREARRRGFLPPARRGKAG
jgi:hypothetical protein